MNLVRSYNLYKNDSKIMNLNRGVGMITPIKERKQGGDHALASISQSCNLSS